MKHGIAAATLVVLIGSNSANADDPKKAASDKKRWKVLAQFTSSLENRTPKIPIWEKNRVVRSCVFRKAGELGAKLYLQGRGRPTADSSTAEKWAAKTLKVRKIDWDKQMLIFIQGPIGRWNRRFSLDSITHDGMELTVKWHCKIDGIRITMVRALLLVPRFDGKVNFVRGKSVRVKEKKSSPRRPEEPAVEPVHFLCTGTKQR